MSSLHLLAALALLLAPAVAAAALAPPPAGAAAPCAVVLDPAAPGVALACDGGRLVAIAAHAGRHGVTCHVDLLGGAVYGCTTP